jgi:ribosome maturation factor RimP
LLYARPGALEGGSSLVRRGMNGIARMDDLKQELLSELEKITDPLGITVVDFEAAKGKRGFTITVVLDRQGGVSIDDCETVSSIFNARLEVLDVLGAAVDKANYSLQVSSPGLYRVLKSRKEYTIFRSRKVRVFLRGPIDGAHPAIEYEGTLGEVEGDAVILDVAGEKLSIPFGIISKTKLNG